MKKLFLLLALAYPTVTMQPQQYNPESTQALQDLLKEHLNNKTNFPKETIKQLIDQGSADPNVIVKHETWLSVVLLSTALARVNMSSHQEFILFLLKRGANPNLEENLNALISFIGCSNECYSSANRYKLVAGFINHGLDVTCKLPLDYTFLHYAVHHSLNIVPLLLENGAGIHVNSSTHHYGYTPLKVARYVRDHERSDEYKQQCQQTVTLLESYQKQKLC